MDINVSSSLNGEYTIYDENMVEIASTCNLITDWGMRRFVGDKTTGAPHLTTQDGPSLAFCSNFKYLFIGQGSTPATPSDWQLENIVDNSLLSLFQETQETGNTGTELKLSTDGDLIMVYTNLRRFEFYPNLSSSYTIRELGANWNYTPQQNNRLALFSRAVLPPNKYVTITAGNPLAQKIYVKYAFYFRTNCNRITTTTHFSGSGSTPFPQNKTNVRRLPLYTMDQFANPVQTLNNNFGTSPWTANDTEEYVQPLFENFALDNDVFVGKGVATLLSTGAQSINTGSETTWQSNFLNSSTGFTNGYKLWWLQFYRDGFTVTGAGTVIDGGNNPANRFNHFDSTTTRFVNNSETLGKAKTTRAQTMTYNSVVYTFSASNTEQCLYSNLTFDPGLRIGRIPCETPDPQLFQLDSNTWQKRISFLFNPGELPSGTTVLKMYPATLGNWSDSYYTEFFGYSTYYVFGKVYVDLDGNHDYGIVTVFNSNYNPNPDHFVGFQYTFTFTRNLSAPSPDWQYTNTGILSATLHYDASNPLSYTTGTQVRNIGTLSADSNTHGTIDNLANVFLENNALRFTGASSTAGISFPQFDFGTLLPTTFNIWTYVDSAASGGRTSILTNISNPGAIYTSTGFIIAAEADSDNRLRVENMQGTIGTYRSFTTDVGSLIKGQWFMLTVVYEPLNQKMFVYKNGQPLTLTGSNDLFPPVGLDGSSLVNRPWFIGKLSGSTPLNGYLGEIKICVGRHVDRVNIFNEYMNTKANYGL